MTANPSAWSSCRGNGRCGGQGAATGDQQRGGQPATADRAPHSGSVVTWRRAQIVLLSAQRMSPPRISEVVFTDPDTVREVIHNFNRDGFDALYPRYAGGRPQTFTLPQRQQIKRIALSTRPTSAALCDLEPGQAGRLPGRRGGGHRHLPRGPTRPAPRGRRPLSSGEDVEALQRPRLRGQTRPHPGALRARRHRPGDGDLPR